MDVIEIDEYFVTVNACPTYKLFSWEFASSLWNILW